MNTDSHNLCEPYNIGGQKYINMKKKEDLGVCQPGLTQKAFTVEDKFDYKAIIEKMEVYGLCVVKNFIETSRCDEILKEIEPHFYRYESWQGSPFPKETTVATRSVLHSSTILKDVVCDRMFCDISKHFLNEENLFAAGKVINKCTSDIQLNSGIVYKVGAGASDQGYHREDIVHHTTHQACESFQYGTETMVGLGVAFTDMNKENGSTRMIVGSHLWGPHDSCGNFDKRMEFHVNVAKGDAVLFLGSLYHAASANRTSQDRVAGYFFMTKSYLKPEENLHLGTDLRVFKGLPLEALQLLGLGISEPFCGHIDYKSPGHLISSSLFENDIEKGYYGETIRVNYGPTQ
ncbi:BAQ_1a_G0031010.mRNA.1.CDS.1 [Saccharomyces cerevisiae]|nr:BAQ_1a_G0031010.mRNA.1.CDS.1 [Saccharomyces cerevisiae]CAI4589849.1 BAM_G0030970.mRNA.1.CDS.1 [Saccharomyces cerevisiae]CAI7186987.1 BAM_G0030970.mRNA.1.CDS.1 [Saccharomyces cerevisiae]CAI7188937.1 BAQ_1a_G0031010.mRNA.1.CDS.1 [Saccharomyces cerevisiae]